jgi:ribosomal protein L37AE/L43A
MAPKQALEELEKRMPAGTADKKGDNMKCPNCGSSSIVGPTEKTSLEIWHCNECGNECHVHCNYIPDLSGVPMHDLYVGTTSVNPGSDALKSLLRLKKVLAFAERFEPARLEEQHRAGKLTWELGYFLDFEVAQATAVCLGIGVPVTFEIVRPPPSARTVD